MNRLSKEMQFFIFLLESYADFKGVGANKILQQFNQLGLTHFILHNMYERYHTERLENAFEDIDKLIAEKIAVQM